jgi:hypothetical protein
MSEISKEFKDWACSFSGCDGGNPNADIWLCGIEWGYIGKEDEKENYYKKELPKEIKKGVAETDSSFKWADSITYPYGRSFAKLYQAIQGENVESYKDVSNLIGDELFKLNLYPIAFNHTGHDLWHKYGVDKITGFDNKYLFNTWCFFNRFPAFTKFKKELKKRPKLIVCTGVDYLRDFLMCFGGNANIDKIKIGKIKPNSENNKIKNSNGERTYYYVKSDETLLIVMPFFSRGGLNSNHLLQEMGNRIRELLNDKN